VQHQMLGFDYGYRLSLFDKMGARYSVNKKRTGLVPSLSQSEVRNLRRGMNRPDSHTEHISNARFRNGYTHDLYILRTRTCLISASGGDDGARRFTERFQGKMRGRRADCGDGNQEFRNTTTQSRARATENPHSPLVARRYDTLAPPQVLHPSSRLRLTAPEACLRFALVSKHV